MVPSKWDALATCISFFPSELSRSATLRAKLAQLQKEKEELDAQLFRQRENHEKKVEDYITRYVNADFWLAQLNTILVML